jgi:microcin C transport system substrate-binding protein
MRGLIPPKHQKNFTHTSYVNPTAPKKGTIKLPAKRSTYSSFNPFILNGVEASGLEYTYASLMKSPLDDQMVAYPYIAEDIEISKDGLSVTFTLRGNAYFSDGSLITTDDVEFSYEMLKKHGKPSYAVAYENVTSVEKINQRKIRFNLENLDKSTPFSLSKMPIVSKEYYKKIPFDKADMAIPVVSGPYKIKDFKNGKYIIYERIPGWWGENLPITKGLYNFDKIKFVHYYNYDAIVDGLIRGEVDYNVEMKVSRWENKYEHNSCKKNRIITKEFNKPVPHGLNAFFLNTRRPHLSDPKARKALNLLFNFGWINKVLFNNRYKRSKGIFNNKNYNFTGNLSAKEKTILGKMGVKSSEIYDNFEDEANQNSPNGLTRKNIDHAIRLLAESGWVLKNGILSHEKYGPFSLEILLPAASMARIFENYRKNLQKMGINASIKTVDPAQFESRLHCFDYDLILFFMPLTYIPGKSLKNIWGSKASHIEGSYNLSGVDNKHIDLLVQKISQAENMDDIKLYASLLDRIVSQEYYYIPAWYRDEIYVAYRDKFGYIDSDENGYSINAWWLKE